MKNGPPRNSVQSGSKDGIRAYDGACNYTSYLTAQTHQIRRRLLRKYPFRLLAVVHVVYAACTLAQMPPHPLLIERIQKGELLQPYALRKLESIRAMGVDRAWVAPELKGQADLTPGGFNRRVGPAAVPTGSWRALAILVKFSDKPAQVTAASFDTLLFASTSGSLRDYFQSITYAALDIVTADLPSSTGWVTVAQTYAYYVNGQNGLGTYPQNAQKLVEDAVNLLDPVIDFSQYDNDNNGYVDALFVIHAGPGAEYTGSDDDIWSHAWQTYTPQSLDGVIVREYSTEPEYWETPGDMTIGVYAHELGHAGFGLPDLYDTDYTSRGLGKWSVMAGGSWNGTAPGGNYPAFPDAWSHAQMGYVTPVNVTTNTTGAQCHSIETDPEVYRLWTGGTMGDQYFLVENRQKTGYDTYLPGSGLAIYHVDESVTAENTEEWYPPGHTHSGHYLVALEQADGLWHLEKDLNGGNSGDTYPGSTDNRNFSTSTTPDSKDYSGATTFVAVTNISSSASIMTADFVVQFPVPVELASFTARFAGAVGVLLEWTTFSETNNYGFEIQRCRDTDNEYQTVPKGFIPGHGTTIVPRYYSFVDSNDTPGIWLYRLKQVDLDGTTHCSEGISVNVLTDVNDQALPLMSALIQNYPNPFNPTTKIEFTIVNRQLTTVKVYDMLGREVSTVVDEVKEPGTYTVEFDASGLAGGAYFCRLIADNFVQTRKLVLLR